jgi:hypothetical protein
LFSLVEGTRALPWHPQQKQNRHPPIFASCGRCRTLQQVLGYELVTVAAGNWFGSNPAASLAEITAGNGLRLDSSVLQLVQAMATYSANNPGFDPATVTQAPTDSSLQTAIAGAWH